MSTSYANAFSDIRYEDPTVEYPFHDLANSYPLLEGESFDRLVTNVRGCGVRLPVVFLDGHILDGRNRYRAARECGLMYPAVDYTLFNPAALVRSLNDMRRESGLPVGARALAAAEVVTATDGRPGEETRHGAGFLTTAQAAEVAGLSERTVRQAKAVLRDGVNELAEAVKADTISLKSAAEVAKLPAKMQAEIIRNIDPKVRATATKEIRAAQQEAKKARRVEREANLAQKITALPDAKFGVIVADPEWSFEVYSHETGMDRAAANHYPVSATEAIMARDVASIAADDCVLFLWATAPMVEHALRVMAAWGFAYKSQVVWVKDRIGTGYWFRNQHEIFLVGVRGNVPAPAMGDQFPSVIKAPVGEHSAKPDCFLEMVESYFPTLPKIELNRRGQARDGWSAWGNEVAA